MATILFNISYIHPYYKVQGWKPQDIEIDLNSNSIDVHGLYFNKAAHVFSEPAAVKQLLHKINSKETINLFAGSMIEVELVFNFLVKVNKLLIRNSMKTLKAQQAILTNKMHKLNKAKCFKDLEVDTEMFKAFFYLEKGILEYAFQQSK